MRTYSRGEFLSLSALLAGGAILSRTPATRALERLSRRQSSSRLIEADLVVLNARVLTMDLAAPRVEAFAVKDGRFVAIGTSDEMRNVATARTTVLDGRGMTVVPGFIDCHCHPSGVNELYGVDGNVRTIRALQGAIRQRAASTPPGYWVNAFMFDDTKLEDGPLHMRHLDEAAPNHPVSVNHRGGHTSWYNSTAFALARITRDTPDPEDGRYFRDESGAHNGRVAEAARGVFGRVGLREPFTPEQRRERARNGMRHISTLLTAAGLTSVHDASANPERIQAYEDTREHGELRHRAYMMIRGGYEQLRDRGVKTGTGDEWIRVGGVKFSADGSASERTMRMSTPYVGTNDYGILTMTQQEIHEAVEDAHRNGWQVGIHANGDVTIDMVLQAYERVLARWPHPDRRHRIEHCSLVNPSLIARIKATGTIPTPFWTYVYYHGEKWAEYGPEKMRWMFAHRSFLDSGILVPGASDYGPGPFEPMMALQSMVTRRDYRGREWGPNQRVSIDDALRIATIHGARASYEEALKGSITVGKLGDFVMLAEDPHDVPAERIKDIRIARTVTGGRTVYEA
jgi:predicted amidohydrolase YtcJ